jgi:tetraacyldisaccharide 4'-kinase
MDRVDQRTRVLDYIRLVFAWADAAWEGLVERSLGRALARGVVRRLDAPGNVSIVGVGGATMGGSGKTPLAIECAAELARAGARVALVGHAYRATPGHARYVSPVDALEDVGDEALLAARALAPFGPRARVVVAPTRSAAMALGASAADVLVLDGVAQLEGARVALSLLAVDALVPWGLRGALFPRGQLRAPIATLVAACDAIVPVGIERDLGTTDLSAMAEFERGVWPLRVESRGAWVDAGTLLTWEAMRSVRVGLLAALGRPERVVTFLTRQGIEPRAIVRARDHGPFAGRARRLATLMAKTHGIDLWLATPKCALHVPQAANNPSKKAAPFPAPLGILEHAVALHPSLRGQLHAIRGVPGQPAP